MTIDAALERFRAREQDIAAAAGSTVTIHRPGASVGAFNPETLGYDDPDEAEMIHEGAAIIRPATRDTDDDTEAAVQEIDAGRWLVKVFDLTASFRIGDLVTVNTSEEDPSLAGSVLTVRAIPKDDLLVSRRLICGEDRT